MKKKLALAAGVAVLACLSLPSSPAVAAGCPGGYPSLVSTAYDGFLVFCVTRGGLYARVENISTIVYGLQPTPSSIVDEVTGPSTSTLLGLATWRAAPPGCRGAYCVLPPGGSAYIRGRPAQVYVSADTVRTQVALSARLVAGQIERRLWPKAMRRIGSVTTCAQNIASTLRSDGWTAMRYGINVSTSCPSLMRELYPSREQQLALNSRILRVGGRILKQEGFLDVLLSLGKRLIRF
jgi:hypothetical protein